MLRKLILPDLNNKIGTIIQLFKDIDYDPNENKKLVKPILREISKTRQFTKCPTKKRTFNKIVLL